MTPFPETEIMTIKRLEVALRKMDYKLLKDGAYKLHEKFHGGHQFEYIDLLKEILDNVSSNPSIPEDTKGILIPTINDILISRNVEINQDYSGQRVSSLTSLSYTIPQEPKEEENTEEQNQEIVEQNEQKEEIQEQKEEVKQEIKEEKINAFSAFSAPQTQNIQTQNIQPQKTFTQSPFSAQPFKEFSNPLRVNSSIVQPQPAQQVEQTGQAAQEEKIEKKVEVGEEIKKELKSVAIFFNQNSSYEKNRNIKSLREEISKINDKDISLNKILDLTCEINIQANIDVSPLRSILEQVKNRENRVNLITNSQSCALSDLFEKIDLEYSFLSPEEDKNINFIPLLGLSNLFVCSECNEEYLDKDSKVAPLVLQCPKCKKPMFANLYAAGGVNSEINLNYYNATMVSLVNSKVWVLINPSLDDKFSINILRNALRMSNSLEEIYILDKDINVKEQYRNMFHQINENIKTDIQTTALEEFLNSIK